MATTKRSKKTPKPPQGRPVSTTPISQPVVEDSSSIFTLSAFSPKGDLFAFVSLAVDKNRLHVYNTTTGQAIADYIVDTARVSSMMWCALDLGEADTVDVLQPSKKKRKKKQVNTSESDIKNKATEVVVLGLSNGTIHYFSPSHDRVLRSLYHASNASAILATAVEEGENRWLIWASRADGTLQLWNANKNEIVGSWKNDDRMPYTSLTIRPIGEEDQTYVLAASHTIRLLSRPGMTERIVSERLQRLAAFTGHASPIKSTKWDLSKSAPTRFISMAETDRFLYVWDIPDSPDTNGRPIASIPLDSDAISFSLAASTGSSNAATLLALSASGKIALYPIPQQISTPISSNHSSTKLPTLHPRSSIIAKPSTLAHVVNVSFMDGEPGNIRAARLIRGIRPVFTVIRYLDEAGHFIENLQLQDFPDVSLEDIQPLIPNWRYIDSSVAVCSGIELGHDENAAAETTVRDIDGDLEVDLAELSLGQRLAAVAGTGMHRSSDSEGEGTRSRKSQPANKKEKPGSEIVPANSLTRTLIQALHSSDTKLIETCLAHSNPDLIRNTVRRLPPQLAIPLLNACVERLGRGARAANMRGGGAGASTQRGMTLVTWVRTVLAVHTGHLMTVPDLVARLSGLHATLTARLALQESLLSLSGRLDMVLSQIEMRSSIAPAPLAPKNGKALDTAKKITLKRYVEGESDSSDDDSLQMDVEVEIGDSEGGVEDVELGGDSEDDEDDEDDEAEEEEEEEELYDFINNQAEEEYSEDEEDESD